VSFLRQIYKKINEKFSYFLIFLFSSCSSFSRESPTIYVSNLSSNIVKNIAIKFPRQTLNLPQLNPVLTQGISFIINDAEDFFGTIKVSWNNLYNENIIRDFTSKKAIYQTFLIQKILVIFRFILKIMTFKLSHKTPRIRAIKPLKWI